MKLDSTTASEKDSKEVCPHLHVYAQKGCWNIFISSSCFALALPVLHPYFFIATLSDRFSGLFQGHLQMPTARAAPGTDAKKIVEWTERGHGPARRRPSPATRWRSFRTTLVGEPMNP